MINLKTKPVFQALLAIPYPAVEHAIELPAQPPLQGVLSDGFFIFGIGQFYYDHGYLATARMAQLARNAGLVRA
jgi:hypothetical protein